MKNSLRSARFALHELRGASAGRNHKTTGRLILAAVLLSVCAGRARGQDTAPAPTTSPSATPAETVRLTVPKGTPLQVALDREVRLQKVGQPIHGRVVEPVYAFDKIVLPVGTEVTGQITKIEGISGGKRTAAALDADFTPAHKIQVEFNQLILAEGKHIDIHTTVTPGSGQVIQFITAANDQKKGVKDVVAEKAKQAKEEAKREWGTAMKQVKAPGKLHRIGRYAVAQLPVHPQYIDAGTVYFAELEEPLDFGSEPLTPKLAASINSPPPDGSVVHARLLTPLSSATAQKSDEVEAVVSEPLFAGDNLIIPQGTLLKGFVVQVEPARHLSRNGQLRFVFHDLVLPNGLQQKVDAILEAVQSNKVDNVKLDSEGGAEATPPKTRFLAAGASVGLGLVSFGGDSLGDMGPRIAGGAGGYKLIGIVIGAAVRSQQLGMAMGAFGASMSIYTHFIARGRDVMFPKDTAMEIGIGTRPATAAPSSAKTTTDNPSKQ